VYVYRARKEDAGSDDLKGIVAARHPEPGQVVRARLRALRATLGDPGEAVGISAWAHFLFFGGPSKTPSELKSVFQSNRLENQKIEAH
jgi:hypothetical protein